HLAVVHEQLEVLPDALDRGVHREVPAPLADLDRAVLVVDDRRGAVYERAVVNAVQVEAASGGVQLEPAVERGEQALPLAGRYVVGHAPVGRPWIFRARAQRERDQPLVDRRDAVYLGRIRRVAQERRQDRRLAVHLLHHAPLAFAGDRRPREGLQRGRDV